MNDEHAEARTELEFYIGALLALHLEDIAPDFGPQLTDIELAGFLKAMASFAKNNGDRLDAQLRVIAQELLADYRQKYQSKRH